MWIKTLSSFSSILELRDYSKAKNLFKNKKEIRALVKIGIIDDEKFGAHGNLATYGYDITELPDIKDVSEASKFDIILCDLMGVGQNFDQKLGGASIIKEIKLNYPTVHVIAYTGARKNIQEATAAKEFADKFLKKDAEISTWVEYLDSAIEIVTDPYERWLIARQGLIDDEIDIRLIIELESAYVEAIKNKDKEFCKLKKTAGKLNLGGHAKGIIHGLISSTIYTLLLPS